MIHIIHRTQGDHKSQQQKVDPLKLAASHCQKESNAILSP